MRGAAGIARSKHPFSGYELSHSPIVTHGPPGSASAKAVFAPSAMLDSRAESGQLTGRVWFFQSTDCTGWCPVTINEATAPWPLFKSVDEE